MNLELPHHDCFHLDAAVGWLGLDNWREANNELDQIAPSMRAHPDVLRIRWAVCAEADQWESAFEIAQSLVANFPEDREALYNLAVCCCKLGKLKDAKDYLQRGVDLPGDIDTDIRPRALVDPAFEPLWTNIGNLCCGGLDVQYRPITSAQN